MEEEKDDDEVEGRVRAWETGMDLLVVLILVVASIGHGLIGLEQELRRQSLCISGDWNCCFRRRLLWAFVACGGGGGVKWRFLTGFCFCLFFRVFGSLWLSRRKKYSINAHECR